MGFARSWNQKVTLSRKKWDRAVADCETVCQRLMKDGLVLVEELDRTTAPIFGFRFRESASPNFSHAGPGPVQDDAELVRFNGLGIHDGHETFMIVRDTAADADDKGRTTSWCKTERKPYDLAVCCCLIVFAHHFGRDFRVSSDGDDNDKNWVKADSICREMLGYGKEFEVDPPVRHLLKRLPILARYSRWPGWTEEKLLDDWAVKYRGNGKGGANVFSPGKAIANTSHHSRPAAYWAALVGWWEDALREFEFDGKIAALLEMARRPGNWLPLLVTLDEVDERYGTEKTARLRRYLPRQLSGSAK